MGSVNHDRLSEFLSNGTGRRFCRVSGAENIANFAHGIDALVNDGDGFFRSRRFAFVGGTFARFLLAYRHRHVDGTGDQERDSSR